MHSCLVVLGGYVWSKPSLTFMFASSVGSGRLCRSLVKSVYQRINFISQPKTYVMGDQKNHLMYMHTHNIC